MKQTTQQIKFTLLIICALSIGLSVFHTSCSASSKDVEHDFVYQTHYRQADKQIQNQRNIDSLEYLQRQLADQKDDINMLTEKSRKSLLISAGIVIVILVIALIWTIAVRQKHISQLQHEKNEAVKARTLAEKANLMKTSFLNNITHELRTPLHNIQGYSELLYKDDLQISPEDRQQFVSILKENIRNLTKLVEDAIEITLLESRSKVPANELFNLMEMCQGVIHNLEPLKHPGVEIIISPRISPNTLIKSDASLYRKVIENYLSNALKYTEQGTVTIDFETINDRQRLSVTDTGCGISPQNANKIFKRFEKLGSMVQGNGLGLSIVRYIAFNLRGRAWLDTGYSGGARFYFECQRHK